MSVRTGANKTRGSFFHASWYILSFSNGCFLTIRRHPGCLPRIVFKYEILFNLISMASLENVSNRSLVKDSGKLKYVFPNLDTSISAIENDETNKITLHFDGILYL